MTAENTASLESNDWSDKRRGSHESDVRKAHLATCVAAVNSSRDELMASSSGGAFSIVARAVLERGGVVYGHAFVSPSTTPPTCTACAARSTSRATWARLCAMCSLICVQAERSCSAALHAKLLG